MTNLTLRTAIVAALSIFLCGGATLANAAGAGTRNGTVQKTPTTAPTSPTNAGMMQNSAHTSMQSVGEALTTVARK